MTKETLLTCLVALKADRIRCVEYAKQYPDGGWSSDSVYRIDNAIKEVEIAISNK